MKFAVLSRDMVERFDCEQPYILISITCPDDTEPTLLESKTRLDVLKLRFHDWDTKAKDLLTTKYKDNPRTTDWVFFNEEHARKIIKFVKQYQDKVEIIAVNCAAGISRSAGCVAALSKCMTGEDDYFFKHYIPNSLVYSTIIRIWNSLENVK
jgi:predicted protein tyrosine phosphatase